MSNSCKSGKRGSRRLSASRKRSIAGYLYTLPAVLYMLLLIGFPAIYNWYISFHDMTIKTYNEGTVVFSGLENYMKLFRDPEFWNAFSNTFIYTIVCLVVQFSFGLLLAVLFSKRFPGSSKIRGLLVVSWLVPAAVTALMFKYMLSTDGIINEILMRMGLIKEKIGWLINPDYALTGVIIANCWVGIPFNMLLLSTGLNNIPADIYESAALDGAGAVKRFFHITLPLLKNSIMAVLILGFVYTFKVFDLVYTMTNGGPMHATEVLSTVSYFYSFQLFDFGVGAAAANVSFLVLFAVGLVYLHLIGKEETL